jgi:hypothetical protein
VKLKPGEDPFDPARFDPKDPDPWLALYLDHSLPIDEGAKRALLLGARSWSRRWLFPVARPLVFLFFCLVKVLRAISPKYPNHSLGPAHLCDARGQCGDPAPLPRRL